MAREVLAEGKVCYVHLYGAVNRVNTELSIASQGNRLDVTGADAIRLDKSDDSGREFCSCERDWHSVNLGRIKKALHVLVKSKDSSTGYGVFTLCGLRVATDAFENGRPVMDDVT